MSQFNFYAHCSTLLVDAESFILPRISELADSDETLSDYGSFFNTDLNDESRSFYSNPQLDDLLMPRYSHSETLDMHVEDFFKVD